MTTREGEPPQWLFVVFPAVAMLLGWGLRGYIGGGPFGAMIPGCFVALCLSLLIGHGRETAATVALFGAVGIGYGGDMTYGQTLGFATNPDTVSWGLLGVTVKGTVWGLLGGAVLGLGLACRRVERRKLLIAVAISIAAFYVGWKLINEPKLIYFSNRYDRPREESWAGLLFAAVALLAYLRLATDRATSAIPLRFAMWGALGGGLGFGGGTLWMVFGPGLPVEQKYFGWWKMMEFSFGLIFGAFLGYCAWLNRDRLRADTAPSGGTERAWPMIALVLLVATAFWILPAASVVLRNSPVNLAAIGSTLLGRFIVFGGLCILIGLYSRSAAWQIAITLTFFHTVYDLIEDLSENLGAAISAPALVAILIVSTAGLGIATWRLRRTQRAVCNLFLLVLWACYAVSCARTFLQKEYWAPIGESGGILRAMMTSHPSMLLTHGIFTASAVAATVLAVVHFSRRAEDGRTAG
jgi:hypothetical protein